MAMAGWVRGHADLARDRARCGPGCAWLIQAGRVVHHLFLLPGRGPAL